MRGLKLAFGGAVCLIAEAYDEQSTVIIIPCSTNPLASRSRGNAATSCCSSPPLLSTDGRAPPPPRHRRRPKLRSARRHRNTRSTTGTAGARARQSSKHKANANGSPLTTTLRRGRGQGYSPASSALRSAIPASCAPAAGAVALITAAVDVVDRLLAPPTSPPPPPPGSQLGSAPESTPSAQRQRRPVHRARGRLKSSDPDAQAGGGLPLTDTQGPPGDNSKLAGG